MKELGINVILGKRLDVSSVPPSALISGEEHTLRTVDGDEIRAGLVVRMLMHLLSFYTHIPPLALMHRPERKYGDPGQVPSRCNRPRWPPQGHGPR